MSLLARFRLGQQVASDSTDGLQEWSSNPAPSPPSSSPAAPFAPQAHPPPHAHSPLLFTRPDASAQRFARPQRVSRRIHALPSAVHFSQIVRDLAPNDVHGTLSHGSPSPHHRRQHEQEKKEGEQRQQEERDEESGSLGSLDTPLGGSVEAVTDESLTSNFPDASRSKVLIIYTGGTFGMQKGEGGILVPTRGYLRQALHKISVLGHPAMPLYDLLEWDDPLDSSDFSPDDWAKLGSEIAENYYNYAGFVVLHGTDTMAYTASALSFALTNLGKPVVLTGAVIPLDELFNDALRNLIASMLVAAYSNITEVCICFDDDLFRGNRCQKVAPHDIDAFQSPNCPPLAKLGVHVKYNQSVILRAPTRSFQFHPTFYRRILVVWLTPGFDDGMLCSMAHDSSADGNSGNGGQPWRGLVLMLYGTGNAPTKKRSFLDALSYLMQHKCEIVVTSQCNHGAVDWDLYATGIELRRMGIIDGKDMTPECAATKMSFLMGRGYRGPKLKALMECSIAGELTESPERSLDSSVTFGSVDGATVISSFSRAGTFGPHGDIVRRELRPRSNL